MIKHLVLAFTLGLLSFTAAAEFDYVGNGTLQYPTGTETHFTFGFAYKKVEFGHIFKVGSHEMEVEHLPSKYSIWLNLHDDKNVFVQEFAKGYFEGFEWKLGDNTLTLRKKVFEKQRARADYVLNINGIDYFFKGKNGQIDILFNDKGIRAIETDGFIKDIGLKD